MIRLIIPLLAAVSIASSARCEQTTPASEKEFRKTVTALMDDPLADSAKTLAKGILAFVSRTPDAEVVLGEHEFQWIGKEDQKHGLALLGAYVSGNALSQLDSGVVRNDRYAGLLQLFRVHRTLAKNDKDYKNPEVDALLKLHKEGKLLKHLQEIADKETKPAKKPNAKE